jgi:hypothetical protein
VAEFFTMRAQFLQVFVFPEIPVVSIALDTNSGAPGMMNFARIAEGALAARPPGTFKLPVPRGPGRVLKASIATVTAASRRFWPAKPDLT